MGPQGAEDGAPSVPGQRGMALRRRLRSDDLVVRIAGRRSAARRGDHTGASAADALVHRRLELAVEAAGLGMWDLDVRSGISFNDDRCRALYGLDHLPADGVSDEVYATLIHPDDAEVRAAEIAAFEADPTVQTHTITFRMVRPDGEIRWMSDTGAIVRDGDGRPVRKIGVSRDVTEERRLLARLAESEERFRTLADALPDTAYRLERRDDGWHVAYVSPAVRHLVGLEPDEVLGRPDAVLDRVLPDDRQALAVLVADAGPVGPVIVRFRLPDGTITWSEHRGVAVAESTGRVVRVDALARDVTLAKRYEAQLLHEAAHDAVTRLARRETFLARLDAALGAHATRPLAVVALHLDRVSFLSDVVGQAAGEQVLQAAAERLRRRIRPGELLARTGATEFAVSLPGGRGSAAAARADHLVAVLSRPFDVDGTPFSATARAGVAATDATGADGAPVIPRSGAVLLEHARAALAKAKLPGGRTVEVFDPSVLVQRDHRRAVGTELVAALERGELALHVQPEIDLRTGRVVGGEALVRWHSPSRGTVMPADFIPLAEGLGLAGAVGSWVVARACELAARFRSSVDPSFVLRCNLSATELADTGLAARVLTAIEAQGLPPSALCLEVTETSVLEDLDAALPTIAALKDAGVGLALDDFGTGYSSLVYLKRFPVDAVKIDRSFVSGIEERHDDAAIVSATVQLAHALRRHVTAEGIETPGQLEVLTRLGCDTGQGYLFSRPLPPDEFEAWCRTTMGLAQAVRAT